MIGPFEAGERVLLVDQRDRRYPTEIAEVVVIRRYQNQVGAGDAEERAEERE